jgi:putative transposase
VLVIKYRRKLLTGTLDNDCKEEIKKFAIHIGCEVQSIESDMNHLHMLVSMQPHRSVDEVVKLIKFYSHKNLWDRYREMFMEQLGRADTMWSDGYCAVSTGGLSAEVVKEYIQNQKLR